MEMWESMTPCERSGISGSCGMDCKALRDGDCEDEEMLSEWEEYSPSPEIHEYTRAEGWERGSNGMSNAKL